MAETVAIDAPFGDCGSLSYVGASLLRAADDLGWRPLAVPGAGIQAASSPPAVRRGLERHRAFRMRGRNRVDRCLHFGQYHGPMRMRASSQAALLYWDSDFIPERFASVLRGYDELFGVSQFVADVMATATGRQVGVLHHGFWPEDCPYVQPPVDGPFTFLHLGQVDERKATDLLLRAFVAAFPRGNEEVRLVIKCGEGHESRARAWHAEHGRSDRRIVIDPRTVARRELSGYFARCHAVVLPSRCEAFGLVGLEALAHGRMLIATDWAGPRDYLDAADCLPIPATAVIPALLYPGQAREPDFDALVAALRGAAADREDARRCGEAACARVAGRWTWLQRMELGFKRAEGVHG